MAAIGIAAAGAALGGTLGSASLLGFGVQAGISAGFLVGSILGELIFASSGPTVKGPRLGDTKVQVSTYGVMITIVHGTMRVAGNVTYMPAEGIKEKKVEESAGKGGLGGGQTVVTFVYLATLEVALCESTVDNPVDDVIAVWADSKLIFDKRTQVKLKKRYKKMKIRFRNGDESQLPDSVWETEFGAGNVPGGRGVASILIEDLPLADFGNRIPNITALAARNTSMVQDAAEHFETTGAPDIAVDNWLLDRDRSVLYALGQVIGGTTYLIKYDVLSGKYLFDSSHSDLDNLPSNGLQFDIDKDGFIYAAADPNDDYGIGKQTIVRIDPSTLGVIQIGQDSLVDAPYLGVDNPTGDVLVSDEANMAYAIESGAFPENIYGFSKGTLTHMWTLDLVDEGFDRPRHAAVDKDGTLWVLSSSAGDECRLFKVSQAGSILETFDLSGTFTDVSIIRDIGYWKTQHKLLIGDATRLALWDIDTETLGSAVAPSNGFKATQRPTYRIGPTDEGLFWITEAGAGQGWQEIDLTTDPPTRVQNLGVGDVPGSHTGYMATVYDEQRQGLVSQASSNPGDDQFDFIPLGRTHADTVQLSVVVSDLCEHTGLEAGDIDVTELTDTVNGYMAARQGSARSMIEPLATGFFFDGYQGDTTMKFPKRGGAIDATIDQDDTAAHEPGQELPAPVLKTRGQSSEVPKRVNVKYMDLDENYQDGQQSDGREITDADHELQVELPIALTSTTAKQIASTILRELNVNKDAAEIRVAWKHLNLDPTDVIQIEEFR